MRTLSLIAVAGLCSGVIIGCGGGAAEPTPATFTAASAANPLDGGVISNNGSDAEWDIVNGQLKTVVISGRDEGAIEFGDPVNGVVVPREISTDGGASVFSIDRNADEVSIQTNVPFGVGPVEFTGPLPNELVVTRDLFLPNARASNGAAGLDAVGCDDIVSSVDVFCGNYLANSDAALNEVIEFATSAAEQELGTSIANGFVTSTVTDYFDLLDVFCSGFDEVTNTQAVDLCETVR